MTFLEARDAKDAAHAAVERDVDAELDAAGVTGSAYRKAWGRGMHAADVPSLDRMRVEGKAIRESVVARHRAALDSAQAAYIKAIRETNARFAEMRGR